MAKIIASYRTKPVSLTASGGLRAGTLDQALAKAEDNQLAAAAEADLARDAADMVFHNLLGGTEAFSYHFVWVGGCD